MVKNLSTTNVSLAILRQKHNEQNVTKNPIKKIFIFLSK